jgi:hypothetical protein
MSIWIKHGSISVQNTGNDIRRYTSMDINRSLVAPRALARIRTNQSSGKIQMDAPSARRSLVRSAMGF